MSKLTVDQLPRPECPLGYPKYQIDLILGHDASKFWAWFVGQTGTMCDGQKYDHELRIYKPTACAGNAHGPVVYAHDLREFVQYGGKVTTDW